MAATCSSPAVPPTLFRHDLSSQGSRHGSRCDLLSSPIQSLVVCHAHVLILSADQLEDAIESNPFPEAEAEPKTLHLFFLAWAPAAPDIESLTEAKSPSERFHLTDHVFYLHAPDGIGRSKLAANAEKFLGVAATARNWRTVQKLREMAKAK